ncbi:MAG: sigma-70 factor domain-containing protein, partial [Bdellovibrionales bacterium]
MSKNTTGNEPEVSSTGLSLEQQQAMIHEEIQRFVRLSKERASISIEEINEMLPPEIIAASVLDTFMQALEVNGVAITDSSENKKEDEEDQFFLSDPDKEEKEEEEEEEVEGDTKSNDPVRLYLRKMGSVSLLTREGEVEIARRIEAGEREIVRAITMSPIGTNEIILLGKRLDEGRIKIKAIFRGLEDEETQYDEQEYIQKIHELIGHVKRYQKKSAKSFTTLKESPHNSPASLAAGKDLEKINAELMENFESINFNRKTVNRVVIKFKNLVSRFSTLRKRVKVGVEKTFSKDIVNMAARYKAMETSDAEVLKMSKETGGLSFNQFRTHYLQAADAQERIDRLHKETEMTFEWIRDTYTAIWKGEREADKAKSELV